jgi:PAS domain S-box-containing protein
VTSAQAAIERPSVLLVDDRPENLLALTAVLEPLEVRLVTAGSGEEALRALLGEDFAVVLLDVQMPGMDGFETAEYIRGRERSARTPIIFLTAVSTDMSQVLRGYEAGAVDYVLKPFDPVILRSKVAVFAELERHRRGRERSDQLLRHAWASSPAGMALVDADGRIVRANPALTGMLGSDATAVGSPVADRFHPDDRAALTALGERALRPGEGPATAELRLALDADEVPVAVVAAPVRDAHGEAQSLLLQLEDLRERRASQAALSRAAAERAARDEAEALAGRLARVAALTDGLDALALTELVDELCRRLHEVLAARGAAVRVLDPGGAVVAHAERGAAEHAGRALRQALVAGDGAIELDDGALGVPLRAGGELFGAVAVAGAGAPERQRVALVAHAAERAALIIRRTLLLEREQHVASTLQHDLLPHSLPELPGVSVAAHFRAGGHGIEVGGDWYDVIPLSGGRVGLVVGDVAGRGVAAAARMGQLRSVARAYALEGHSPAAFAQRMNLYHRALSPDDLTTIVYAVIEPDRERLRFVNAGHPPPLLMPARGAPALLTGVTPPLGVSDLPVHPETVVDFAAESALVLYTDGLVERRGEGVDCGLQRLLGAAGSARSGTGVEALRDRVVESCLGPSSGDDDVTALFVRAERELGPSARFTLSPDAESLGALRRMLRRWLAEGGASDADTAAVTMAANEAWENAIEHAHAFAPVPIGVAFERRDEDVYVTVHDAGAPPGESDPDRGRGLTLMQALMDEASFSFGGRYGGSVVLRRRLGSPQAGTENAGHAAGRAAG